MKYQWNLFLSGKLHELKLYYDVVANKLNIEMDVNLNDYIKQDMQESSWFVISKHMILYPTLCIELKL